MPAGNELNKQQRARGQEDQLASKPNTAVISSINSASEEVLYRTGASGSRTPVSHPYLGPNSWIRVMPEKGTRCMISRRAEDSEPYISAYFAESQAKGAIKATEAGNFYYRALREGETDLASPGIANVFLSRRGTLELRGGSTSMSISAENLEISGRAPTHARYVLGNKRQEVGDEERFGVVVRPGALDAKTLGQQPTLRNIVQTVPLFYAKEYLRILRSDGPIPGVTMIEHREGDVYDDSGLPVFSKSTGRNLRSISKYGTTVPGVSTDVEVDVDGNISVSLPPSAIKGLSLSVLGPGNVELLIGKDMIATITKNLTMQVLQQIALTAAAGITLDSKTNIELKAIIQAAINAPLVSLASGADSPAMRGTDWMLWASTHTHGTGVGPSSPPLVPPPANILSTAVTLK